MASGAFTLKGVRQNSIAEEEDDDEQCGDNLFLYH